MRLAAYAGASTVAAAGVVLWAFNQRANFYSACVYLAQSNLCLMILTNLILLITCSFFYALQRLCYGPLRPIEMEQLYEKAWFAITETCLAMTIFREELGAWFLVMFVALLAGKIWGWIGDGRVEILEQQPPANPRLFHARLSTSLALSLLYDTYMLSYAINTVIQQARPNMMVMFLFEFAILMTCSFSTALRYGISLMEAKITKQQTEERLSERRREVREARAEAIRQRDADVSTNGEGDAQVPPDLPAEEDIDEIDIEVPGWEAKGQWVLTLDLVTDLFKLAIYSIFFCILMSFYGLPIHIMRDLFLTARSFIKRLTAFLRYRRATQDMNQRYPDATVEDITREDTCIICREDMRPWSETNPANPPRDGGAGAAPPLGGSPANERSRPKKLPCGHILHLGCLKSWLERQQVCPTCRRSVVESPGSLANRRDQPGNAHGAVAPQQPHQPGAAPPPPAPPRANGGMRMINLGPIRVGFGQANMQEIAQQLGGQQPNPGARMYGFELGFPRNQQQQQPQTATSPPIGPAAQAHAQLQLIEQQIMQQIRSLQLTQQELHLVQLLQVELTRLRNLQSGVQNPTAVPVSLSGVQQAPNIAPHNPFGGIGMPTQPIVQRHAALPGTSSIPSGSLDLPPGVTIPEGWSLLPLQRLDAPGTNTLGAMHTSRHGTASNSSLVDTAPTATSFAAPVSNLSNEVHSSSAPPQTSTPSTTPSNDTLTHPEGSPLEQESPVPNMSSFESPFLSNSSHPTQSPNNSTTTLPNNNTIVAPTAVYIPSSSSSTPASASELRSLLSTSNEIEPQNENENEGLDTERDEERRQVKGKARAVTVEDSIDDQE